MTVGGAARLAGRHRHASRPGSWTHLAATYDGTTAAPLRQRHPGLARSRSPARSPPRASPLKIGGNAIWGEWFNGLIDEVRVYNRALSAAEIQTDMNTVDQLARQHAADRARHADRHRAASARSALSWGAATDNVGVVEVQRPPLARPPASRRRAANRIAQPTGTSYTDTGLAAGHLLLQGHRRRRRRQRRPGRQRGQRRRHGRHHAADGAVGADRDRRAGPGALSWTASTDAGGIARYNVHRSTTSGFTPAPATASRSRPARPTPTPVSPRAPTTTRSPPTDNAGQHQGRLQRGDAPPSPTRGRRPGLVARLRLRRGQRHDDRRPVRQRQQRHAHRRDLGRRSRQVRQRALLQRHQRTVSASPTPTRST